MRLAKRQLPRARHQPRCDPLADAVGARLVAALMTLAIAAGCGQGASAAPAGPAAVRVTVTRDYGATTLAGRRAAPDQSALNALAASRRRGHLLRRPLRAVDRRAVRRPLRRLRLAVLRERDRPGRRRRRPRPCTPATASGGIAATGATWCRRRLRSAHGRSRSCTATTATATRSRWAACPARGRWPTRFEATARTLAGGDGAAYRVVGRDVRQAGGRAGRLAAAAA